MALADELLEALLDATGNPVSRMDYDTRRAASRGIRFLIDNGIFGTDDLGVLAQYTPEFKTPQGFHSPRTIKRRSSYFSDRDRFEKYDDFPRGVVTHELEHDLVAELGKATNDPLKKAVSKEVGIPLAPQKMVDELEEAGFKLFNLTTETRSPSRRRVGEEVLDLLDTSVTDPRIVRQMDAEIVLGDPDETLRSIARFMNLGSEDVKRATRMAAPRSAKAVQSVLGKGKDLVPYEKALSLFRSMKGPGALLLGLSLLPLLFGGGEDESITA